MKKRNANDARATFVPNHKAPEWTSWKVSRAVSDGYTASGWVFRACNAISNAVSSVPFFVQDSDGNPIYDHHVTKLLETPNPEISRQELFSLFTQWLLLSGNAYAKKVVVGGKTTELWGISPDKIAPVVGGSWVDHYSLKSRSGSEGKSLSNDEIIHFKLANPSNPVVGIGVLQAAAKPVDTDVEQQNFNKSAMENRGIMDGVFVVKDMTVSQWETYREKIKEMFAGAKNARTAGVIGGETSYIKTGMTPAEMDFIESRKFNRDEILNIFGVPPQLIGVTEASTFNNLKVSRRIFWEETVIPMLTKIRDSFELSFRGELKSGEKIVYDISNVPAMQESMQEKMKAASGLWAMGVPFDSINKRFKMGFDTFSGSDKSFSGQPLPATAPATKQRMEKRKASSQGDFESIRDDHTAATAKALETLFTEQRKLVVDAIKNKDDPHAAVQNHRDDWMTELRKMQVAAALAIAENE